jgi:hypothetical protein
VEPKGDLRKCHWRVGLRRRCIFPTSSVNRQIGNKRYFKIWCREERGVPILTIASVSEGFFLVCSFDLFFWFVLSSLSVRLFFGSFCSFFYSRNFVMCCLDTLKVLELV